MQLCSKWFKSLKRKKWPNVKEGYPIWLNHNALIICEKNSVSKIKYDFVTMRFWMSKFYPSMTSTEGRYYLVLATCCKPFIQSLYNIRCCTTIFRPSTNFWFLLSITSFLFSVANAECYLSHWFTGADFACKGYWLGACCGSWWK